MNPLTKLSIVIYLAVFSNIFLASDAKASIRNFNYDLQTDLKHSTQENENKTSPDFPGGIINFKKFIGENLKYPEDAKKRNIQGIVTISFDIEKDGSINNARVVKKVFNSLNEEALRVVLLSPKWIPATENGKPVVSNYEVPITFMLK